MTLKDILKASPDKQKRLFRALCERDRLLTKISGIDLWLYDVESDMFYVMFKDANGEVQTSNHPMFDVASDANRPLDEESQSRWVNLIKDLSTDPSLPEEGYIDLYYKDHLRRIRSFYHVVKDKNGKPLNIIGDSEDLSKTKEMMQRVIDEQNDYIRIINGFKSSYEAIVYIDLRDHSYQILEGTEQLREVACHFTNAQDLVREYILKTMLPQYQARFIELANLKQISVMLKDRKYVSFEYESSFLGWLKMRVLPAETNEDGELTHIIVSTESIAEEHREKDQLRIKSEHDGLTGLFNRAAGVSRIEKRMEEENGILVLFDCDKFKSINDTFGHLTGDKVLVEVAKTLKRVCEDQVLFRLGGDEFVVFLQESFLYDKAQQGLTERELFRMLQGEIAKIYIQEMCGQSPMLSAGAARYYKDKPVSFDELYKMADLALYQSKKYGQKKASLMNVTFGQLND